MSADIYVSATKRVRIASVNITYNLGPMLREAGMDFEDFTRLESAALVARLRFTIAELASRPDRYRMLNPPNGWGSYDGLLKALGEVLAALIDPENVDPKVETWL